MKSFRELEVWRESMNLVDQVYGLVASFPKEEQYALSDQIRRAAVSIPSNIAEGFGRETHKDFAHFIAQSRGSLYEVDTQVELALRRGYVTDTSQICETIARVSRMLSSLLRHLKNTPTPGTTSRTKHPAPSTKHQALSTQHQALSTQHQALSTKN